jgi:hypothetical protein
MVRKSRCPLAKAADLLLRFDLVKHADFLAALQAHGVAFHGDDVVILQDQLVGVEVEASPTNDASNTEKSILNNLSKDREVGLDVLVFCVMPAMFKRMKTVLEKQNDLVRGVFLVNVLKLLDALREGQANG